MTALGRMIARRKSGNRRRCPCDFMAHRRSEKYQDNSNAFSFHQCHGNVICGQTARGLFGGAALAPGPVLLRIQASEIRLALREEGADLGPVDQTGTPKASPPYPEFPFRGANG